MSLTSLEHEFIAACCEAPPDFEKAKALLAAGVDINGKDDQGEPFVAEIVFGYPQTAEICCEECEKCEKCEKYDDCEECGEENCEGCRQIDVTYLPLVIEFLISNGLNIKEHGWRILHALCYSTYTKEIMDAAKIVCAAGIENDPERIDDLMDTISTKEVVSSCNGEHDTENLFYAYERLLDCLKQNQSFEHIDTYHAAIGLKIDKIVVFGETNGIVVDEQGRTTFAHDIGFVCGDKTVIIKKDINILLMNGLQNMLPCIPASELFGADICERTITQISFLHNEFIKGKATYGQPVINLHLDDGSVISFTHNYGEMPKGDLIPRFSVKR